MKRITEANYLLKLSSMPKGLKIKIIQSKFSSDNFSFSTYYYHKWIFFREIFSHLASKWLFPPSSIMACKCQMASHIFESNIQLDRMGTKLSMMHSYYFVSFEQDWLSFSFAFVFFNSFTKMQLVWATAGVDELHSR